MHRWYERWLVAWCSSAQQLNDTLLYIQSTVASCNIGALYCSSVYNHRKSSSTDCCILMRWWACYVHKQLVSSIYLGARGRPLFQLLQTDELIYLCEKSDEHILHLEYMLLTGLLIVSVIGAWSISQERRSIFSWSFLWNF